MNQNSMRLSHTVSVDIIYFVVKHNVKRNARKKVYNLQFLERNELEELENFSVSRSMGIRM